MKRLLVLSAALTAGSVAIAAVNSAPADTNNSATDSVKTAEPAKVEAEVSLKAPAAIKVKESAELSVAITPPKGFCWPPGSPIASAGRWCRPTQSRRAPPPCSSGPMAQR